MKAVDQLNWLQEEIDKLVEGYKSDAKLYKKQAFRLRIISVLLAAIITVLLGLKLQNTIVAEGFSNVALVLSAAITVLSAYEAFFDPRALWVRETVTFARLKDIQRDLRYWAKGRDPEDIDVEELNRFKVRLDSILEDTLKYWMTKAELKSKDSARDK